MKPLFHNETSTFNRRLLSSKTDATTNVQCAMLNAQLHINDPLTPRSVNTLRP